MDNLWLTVVTCLHLHAEHQILVKDVDEGTGQKQGLPQKRQCRSCGTLSCFGLLASPSRVTRGGSLQRRSPLRECHSDKETTDITSHHSPLIRKTHVHIELQFFFLVARFVLSLALALTLP